MAELNCEACIEIRDEVPELVVNGFDDDMCTSLQNDTGLKPSSGHDDCTDLDLMNDCLIGNMDTEIDDYDVCDWKEFTKQFINNIWTTLKAIVCTICGLWTNIHNLWEFSKSYRLKKDGNIIYLEAADGRHGEVTDADTKYDLSINGSTLSLTGSDGSVDNVPISTDNTTYTMSINGHTITLTPSEGNPQSVTVPDNNTWKPNTASDEGYVAQGSGHNNQIWATDGNGVPAWRNKDVIDGQAFITYYRDLGTGDSVPYWNNITDGFEQTLSIYMDSHGASSGSQPADRDYVVIISNCTNYRYFNGFKGRVTFYSSGDSRSVADIRSQQGQHPDIVQSSHSETHALINFSWTTSGAVLLKAGEHIRVNFYVDRVDKGSATASEAPSARLHQFILVWIPVSVSTVTPT